MPPRQHGSTGCSCSKFKAVTYQYSGIRAEVIAYFSLPEDQVVAVPLGVNAASMNLDISKRLTRGRVTDFVLSKKNVPILGAEIAKPKLSDLELREITRQ